MTPIELSVLRFQHAPQLPGPCRVCGADMKIARIGGGDATKYVCGSPAADFLAAAARDKANGDKRYIGSESRAALDHYQGSEVRIAHTSDFRVVAVVDELVALRAAAGEDMTVPVGAVHFPNGHGPSRCYRWIEHVGGGVWEERLDFDYTHDPSHSKPDPADTDLPDDDQSGA